MALWTRVGIGALCACVGCGPEESDPPAGSESSTSDAGTSTGGETGVPTSGTTAAEESSGSSGEPEGSSSSGSSGSTGSESSSGGSSSTTGGTGELGPSDADAIDWPEDCAAIVAEEVVCLSIGVNDYDAFLVAMSLETGATCELMELSIQDYDLPNSMVWVDELVAWPMWDEWSNQHGRVVHLDTLSETEVERTGYAFEWNDGLLVYNWEVANWPYYASIDDFITGTISETYDPPSVGSYGFVAEDILRTYDYNGTSDAAVDLLTGDQVPSIPLENLGDYIRGMSAVGDTYVFALEGATVTRYDLHTGSELDVQPINYAQLSALACSPGLTEGS